jgi:hypothetical protein
VQEKWRHGADAASYLPQFKNMTCNGGQSESSVDVVVNTNLVNPKELSSYWDLINPKWKGKVVAFTPITAPHKFFFYQPELGPKFLNQLFGQMDATPSNDIRQIADWLGVGKLRSVFSLRRQPQYRQGAGTRIADRELQTGSF